MGDTDVCPFDVGTFGSRSMPDAGEHLRQAAASARECLLGLAAARWNVGAGELAASEGGVRHIGGSRSVTYGELVRGLRSVEVASPGAPLTPGPAELVVGRPTARLTAPQIVTGSRRYPSDLSRPGMLHGRVLQPPAFGATLLSVDVSKAGALPGVTVVHEGSFVGATAPNPFLAARALQAVEAEWDLPPQPPRGRAQRPPAQPPRRGTGLGGRVPLRDRRPRRGAGRGADSARRDLHDRVHRARAPRDARCTGRVGRRPPDRVVRDAAALRGAGRAGRGARRRRSGRARHRA